MEIDDLHRSLEELHAKANRQGELLELLVNQVLEMRARVVVTEGFSKAAWRVSVTPEMRKRVIEVFRDNMKAAAAGRDEAFVKVLHEAAREMLEGIGAPGVH